MAKRQQSKGNTVALRLDPELLAKVRAHEAGPSDYVCRSLVANERLREAAETAVRILIGEDRSADDEALPEPVRASYRAGRALGILEWALKDTEIR